jgi:hypothetical protein
VQSNTLNIVKSKTFPRKFMYHFSPIFEILRVGTKLFEKSLLICLVPFLFIKQNEVYTV